MATQLVSTVPNNGMVDYPFIVQVLEGDTVLHYSAEDFRLLVDAIWPSSGVLNFGDFTVTRASEYSVNISRGTAVIGEDATSLRGKYLVRSLTAVCLDVPTAAGYHTIVARVRDKSQTGAATYDWVFEAIEGTSTAAPALPKYAIKLADVQVIGGSGISSAPEAITKFNIKAGSPGTMRSIGWRPWISTANENDPVNSHIFDPPSNSLEYVVSIPLTINGLTLQTGKIYRAEFSFNYAVAASQNATTVDYFLRVGGAVSKDGTKVVGGGQFSNQLHSVAETGKISAVWQHTDKVATNQFLFITIWRRLGTTAWQTRTYPGLPCSLQIFEIDP